MASTSDAPVPPRAFDSGAILTPGAASHADATATGTAAGDAAGDATAGASVDAAFDSRTALRPLLAIRRWELGLVALLGCAMFLPLLGSYGLWDPWETHYAEVARRMLQDHDFITTRWQDEGFRSKPVLTFWLMVAGMKLLGVGENGGFSGEFVSSSLVEWSVRLPFALFGIAGIVFVWYTLARLYSRRAAYLGALVTATTPYYFFITRQAITDMPMCATLIGAVGLFALTALAPDEPLWRWRRLSAYHLFLAVFALLALSQLSYFAIELRGTRFVLGPRRSVPGPLVNAFFFLPFLGAVAWTWVATRRQSDVRMYFFYVLVALSILAKGPVTLAIAGGTILLYLIVTGEWRLLARCRIPQGVLITVAIALPWHFAMYMKDGMAWFNEYVGMHLLNRAGSGMHGDRGNFNYYLSQLGIGLFPWSALVPAALAQFVMAPLPRTREEKVRLIFFLWAAVGFFFFSVVTTKFHHYILPAVPALAVMVALWLDDLLDGRVRLPAAFVLVGLPIVALVGADIVQNHDKLVELYIYRYDRPWPSGDPWNVDFSRPLFWMTAAFGLGLFTAASPRWRRWAVPAMSATALVFAVFTFQVLMRAATPHWGQRTLHEVYYAKRKIHGVDILYNGLREVARDWGEGTDFAVRSVIPETMAVGDPMKVSLLAAGERLELGGKVTKIDKSRHTFWIGLPEEERQRLAPLLERARHTQDPPRRRYLLVNADRLIAWQLYWRGENFYSGSEIFQEQFEDARTAFKNTDNKAFLAYLNDPARRGKGRKFWLVTEKQRIESLRGILPTEKAKETLRVEDNSSNKFALASFVLD